MVLTRRKEGAGRFPAAAARILLVEDYASDVSYIRQALKDSSSFYSYAITDVPTLRGAIRQLNAAAFDLIILDLNLTDVTGMVTVRALHAEAPHIPLIVYSGANDTWLKQKALRSGAACYAVKGDSDGPGLNYIVENTLAYRIIQAQVSGKSPPPPSA